VNATSRSSLQSDINVTPLVDVCLVLLIIFMVVTPLMITGVDVKLPAVSAPEALARQPLLVSIKEDGTLFLGRTVTRVEDAGDALRRERAGADRPVVVQADATVVYGRVVEVLDLCREAGFSTVGLAARKRQPVTPAG
jgi:biopolymer transport protein ExbD